MDREVLTLPLRRQVLEPDSQGHLGWRTITETRVVPAPNVGVIVCDMWDAHWSRGATERVNAMAPRMNEVLCALRERGAHIIHAPSDTMDAYAGTPARERALAVPLIAPPPHAEHPDPPLPVDNSDGGSDTGEQPDQVYKAWRRQHPAIFIDHERDLITDEGQTVYSYLRQQGLSQLLIMGAHTNMCILGRSFGIKTMVCWGVDIALVRDLTDAMYNPARPPYVSHDEGTALVIGFIEKFWCPTVASTDLVRAKGDHGV